MLGSHISVNECENGKKIHSFPDECLHSFWRHIENYIELQVTRITPFSYKQFKRGLTFMLLMFSEILGSELLEIIYICQENNIECKKGNLQTSE